MTCGIGIKPHDRDRALQYCENKGLDYTIWNAEEVLTNPDAIMELDLPTEDDAMDLAIFLKKQLLCFAYNTR